MPRQKTLGDPAPNGVFEPVCEQVYYCSRFEGHKDYEHLHYSGLARRLPALADAPSV